MILHSVVHQKNWIGKMLAPEVKTSCSKVMIKAMRKKKKKDNEVILGEISDFDLIRSRN